MALFSTISSRAHPETVVLTNFNTRTPELLKERLAHTSEDLRFAVSSKTVCAYLCVSECGASV